MISLVRTLSGIQARSPALVACLAISCRARRSHPDSPWVNVLTTPSASQPRTKGYDVGPCSVPCSVACWSDARRAHGLGSESTNGSSDKSQTWSLERGLATAPKRCGIAKRDRRFRHIPIPLRRSPPYPRRRRPGRVPESAIGCQFKKGFGSTANPT